MIKCDVQRNTKWVNISISVRYIMATEGFRYKDKVTIVTGGAQGIGQGCVEVFGSLLIITLDNSVSCIYCAQ